MTKLQTNIEERLGEVLKKYGFSFADRLSRETVERVVYQSESVLIRFSYDRGDLLVDVAENKRTPHWYPLQHVTRALIPFYNRLDAPSKEEIAKAKDQNLVFALPMDFNDVSAVLSSYLGQIAKAFSPLDALRAGLLQKISEKEEQETIARIFKE